MTPTLTLSKVSDEHAGEYGCEVGNEEGTTYSGESVVIDVTCKFEYSLFYAAIVKHETITFKVQYSY